jgi:hypothetical protein
LADEPVAATPRPKTVYLYGAADLDHLRETNFNHYQRALRILANGEELCRPGLPSIEYAQFQATNLHCQASLLLTSLPPKKQLEFQLDDIRYIALVTITGDAPRLMKADEPGPPVNAAQAPPPKH